MSKYTNIPMEYKDVNYWTSRIRPSSIHTKNTALYLFFERYLFQKLQSVYKFNIPKEWSYSYFINSLFRFGYIAIMNTSEFGIIPQHCSIGGERNIFYEPSNVIVANPILNNTYDLKIGKDCEVIKMTPDFAPITDIVGYYADLMAIAAESASINILNSKLSYVMGAKNKAAAESLKKVLDEVISGNPAVVVDKALYNPDGSAAWETFTQNLRENYIAGDILLDLEKLEDKFNTDIGIPNANTEKKERMIVDEVNANNVATMTKAEMWLEFMKEGCEKANKMFGLQLSVDFRNKPEMAQNEPRMEDDTNE